MQKPEDLTKVTVGQLFNLSSFPFQDLFKACQYPWEVLDRLKDYLENFDGYQIEGDVSEKAYLVNERQILIAKGARVEPGAYIEGPTLIGPGAVVRHGAYVRGNVIAGADCVIGHVTEVKGSILLNCAQAAHFAYVGDSILGAHCNLGAGTKLANLKLDGTEILSCGVKTGRRKLGAIIGDGAQLGCNSVTSPGAVLGKEAKIYPCCHVQGFVAAGSVQKSR